MLTTGPAVTWIKVEKPAFDLVGVVLGSFRLAGVLLVVAVVLGALLGAALIRSRRRPQPPPLDEVSLHLER
jgi:membrane protein implicated in regulation of membrane protease activity